jgi:hypothetical protein
VPDWTKDNAAGRLALQMAGLDVYESPLHLEGGSIHADGEGCAPYFLFCFSPLGERQRTSVSSLGEYVFTGFVIYGLGKLCIAS